MSHFIVYKCDRCGAKEKIGPAMHTSYFKQETMRVNGSDRTLVHICPKCNLAYTAWLNPLNLYEEFLKENKV